MTAFLFYLLKVILCSGVLFFYYQLALRNRLYHQWNRFYLLAAVALSLLLPLLQFTVFFKTGGQGSAFLFLQTMQSANEYLDEIVITTQRQATADLWFWTGYALICVLSLSFFLLSLIKIVSLIHQHSFETFRKVRFAYSDVPGAPFSFFRYLFWNKEISLHTEAGQQVFEHELVHVEEKHTLDKLFLQLVLSFFWFNPFFWLIRKELSFIHEFIADKKAVEGKDASALAAMILQTVYPQQFATIANPFFQTSIKRRVTMLTKNQRVNYASRILALPILAVVAFAFTVRAKTNEQKDLPTQLLTIREAADTLPRKKKEIGAVDVNTVKKTIALHYSDGTMETLTMEQARKRGLLDKEKPMAQRETKPQKPNGLKPLYIVDGDEFNGDPNSIDPMNIESINVLKDQAAIGKYGEKGKNGVVEITMKKESSGTTNTEPVFTQTETPASIDNQEWRTFLQSNIQPLIVNAAKKGAKPGSYTVNIRFVVRKDGSLSNFEALNDPGYDLAKQMLALMPNSPKWKPAEQNGKQVNSYHVQPVTFVIQEQ